MTNKKNDPNAINEHALAKMAIGPPTAISLVALGRLTPLGSPARIIFAVLAGAAVIYSEYWLYRTSRKVFIDGLKLYPKIVLLVIIAAVFGITILAGAYYGIHFATGNPELLHEHETLSISIFLGCLGAAFAGAFWVMISVFERNK